jgi:hypothetical protein
MVEIDVVDEVVELRDNVLPRVQIPSRWDYGSHLDKRPRGTRDPRTVDPDMDTTPPMTPEEVVHSWVGETYRYRLAVADQLPRIEAATRALQGERAAIKRDMWDHLFAPPMTREAWQEQLERSITGMFLRPGVSRVRGMACRASRRNSQELWNGLA